MYLHVLACTCIFWAESRRPWFIYALLCRTIGPERTRAPRVQDDTQALPLLAFSLLPFAFCLSLLDPNSQNFKEPMPACPARPLTPADLSRRGTAPADAASTGPHYHALTTTQSLIFNIVWEDVFLSKSTGADSGNPKKEVWTG